MINGTLRSEAGSDTIDVSHRRGDDVRDERSNHPPAPARDEPRSNSSEVATHQSSTDILSPRKIEKTLRSAGLSARQAKRLMSSGYAAYAGNVEPDDREALLAETLNFYRALSERYIL